MEEYNQAENFNIPQNLSKIIEFQQGAVVSRTIIKKDNGNVTLFAFDKGDGLSEHTTPYDALVYIIEGKAEITISGKSNNASGGDILIMPAGEPHALKAVEKFKMLLIMIKS